MSRIPFLFKMWVSALLHAHDLFLEGLHSAMESVFVLGELIVTGKEQKQTRFWNLLDVLSMNFQNGENFVEPRRKHAIEIVSALLNAHDLFLEILHAAMQNVFALGALVALVAGITMPAATIIRPPPALKQNPKHCQTINKKR